MPTAYRTLTAVLQFLMHVDTVRMMAVITEISVSVQFSKLPSLKTVLRCFNTGVLAQMGGKFTIKPMCLACQLQQPLFGAP